MQIPCKSKSAFYLQNHYLLCVILHETTILQMKKYKIYIFYALTILVLGIYNARVLQQQAERKQFYDLMFRFFRASENVDFCEFRENAMNCSRLSDIFRLSPDTTLKNANIAINAEGYFEGSLYDLWPFTQYDSTKMDSIEKYWGLLNESFKRLGTVSDLDNSMIDKVKFVCEHGSREQKLIETNLLNLQVVLLLNPILREISNHYEQKIPYPFRGCLPMIELNETCLHAKVPIKGILKAASYGRFTQNLTIKVDGKAQLITNGVVHHTFIKPFGKERKIPVEVILTNPLNQDTKSYPKTFTLKTCN